MANKFKCKDCRHSFSLNAGSESICPKCKSDNIEPVKGSKFIWKLLLFIVMAVVGFCATDVLVLGKSGVGLGKDVTAGAVSTNNVSAGAEASTKAPVAVEGTEISVDEPAPAVNETPKPMEPINAEFNVYEKNLAENGFTFSVAVLADYESEVDYYELYLKEDDENPVLTSTDGTFKSNEYYTADGKYFIQAFYENGNSTLVKSIDGFVKPAKDEPKQIAKLEMSELQSKIDKSFKNRGDRKWYASVGKGGDKRLADKITVKNTTNGKTYTSIAAMFADCWICAKKINVESVTYDEASSRLNAITISIVKK